MQLASGADPVLICGQLRAMAAFGQMIVSIALHKPDCIRLAVGLIAAHVGCQLCQLELVLVDAS